MLYWLFRFAVSLLCDAEKSIYYTLFQSWKNILVFTKQETGAIGALCRGAWMVIRLGGGGGCLTACVLGPMKVPSRPTALRTKRLSDARKGGLAAKKNSRLCSSSDPMPTWPVQTLHIQ
ncbi:hypothetical protein F4677DRAFT_242090 [Hypoxylon crocopeplum]|nr:hypothetical protein F4677DRAFT_242090 [Hypoxylon crocopeplum]